MLLIAAPSSARRLVQRLDDLVVAGRNDRPARFGRRPVVEQLRPPFEAEKFDQRLEARPGSATNSS